MASPARTSGLGADRQARRSRPRRTSHRAPAGLLHRAPDRRRDGERTSTRSSRTRPWPGSCRAGSITPRSGPPAPAAGWSTSRRAGSGEEHGRPRYIDATAWLGDPRGSRSTAMRATATAVERYLAARLPGLAGRHREVAGPVTRRRPCGRPSRRGRRTPATARRRGKAGELLEPRGRERPPDGDLPGPATVPVTLGQRPAIAYERPRTASSPPRIAPPSSRRTATSCRPSWSTGSSPACGRSRGRRAPRPSS